MKEKVESSKQKDSYIATMNKNMLELSENFKALELEHLELLESHKNLKENFDLKGEELKREKKLAKKLNSKLQESEREMQNLFHS